VNDYLFDGSFLLVAEDGANLLARSTPIAFQAHGKFWVNNHAHILQPLAGCPLGYLEAFFNATDLKFYVTGSAQPKLTQRNMNKIPVPLPPLAEQRRIVEEVERRLSVVQALEKAVEANLARAERLRQAILKKAFEGRLVDQDLDDEPASVLLERINNETERSEEKGPRQMTLF
jgi:type I restriction enzyme S subunit